MPVTLSGTVSYRVVRPAYVNEFILGGIGQPVTVLRRLRGAGFVRLATVGSTFVQQPGSIATYGWRLVVRPRATATYKARDFVSQGRIWQIAESGAVTIRVRR
jgi:hypothetical protein